MCTKTNINRQHVLYMFHLDAHVHVHVQAHWNKHKWVNRYMYIHVPVHVLYDMYMYIHVPVYVLYDVYLICTCTLSVHDCISKHRHKWINIHIYVHSCTEILIAANHVNSARSHDIDLIHDTMDVQCTFWDCL